MPVVEICCLANSDKLKGRCIAGLELTSGRWVRPVSREEHGELHKWHCTLVETEEQPRVLDIVRIGLARQRPLCHQPENWILDHDVPWRLVDRPRGWEALVRARERLAPSLQREGLLFGCGGSKIPEAHFVQHPATSSLELIAPEGMRLVHRATSYGPRARVVFRLGGCVYDLPLTDTGWKQRVLSAAPGEYRMEQLGTPPGSSVWLTVSLGEPFAPPLTGVRECYKLVAAVIIWPACQQAAPSRPRNC